MYKSGSPFLVCEELTDAARQAIPRAAARGVMALFDYEGVLPIGTGSPTVMRSVADRLIGQAVSRTRAGSVFILARVAAAAVDRCDVVLDVADTRDDMDDEQCRALGVALDGGPVQGDRLSGLGDLLLAGRLCRACGGRLAVESVQGEGFVAQARLPLACLAPVADERPGDAGGAWLWIIGEPCLTYEPLVRRFQRHGWAVRPFGTVAQALAALDEGAGRPAPALVAAIEPYGVEAGSLTPLRDRLPAAVTVLLLVLHGSTGGTPAGAVPGILVQALPFSPRQVLHFTELGRRAAAAQPQAPDIDGWGLQARPLVLVADDDEVNRILAVQLLRLLGFEAEAMPDGAAVVSACRRGAPAAVLMDLEMPVMDGLSATRELRRLQHAGELAAFPVLAATALTSPSSRDACRAAGMNGLLRKPLHPATLRNELLLCGVAAS